MTSIPTGTRALTRPLALVLGSALVLAGCGQDDDGGEATSPAPTATSAPGSPTEEPAAGQSAGPHDGPTQEPTSEPSDQGPTGEASDQPTGEPSDRPTGDPSGQDPTGEPSDQPTGTPPGGQLTETEVIAEQVFGNDGYPTGEWTIEDRSDQAAFGCWAESGTALEGLAYMCGSTPDYGVACLANPLAEDEVICVTDPADRAGYRHKVAGELPNEPSEQFLPLMVQLEDGSTWALRGGGTGAETPDGYVTFYHCHTGCDDDQALFAPAYGDGVEHDDPVWLARISDAAGTEETEQVPVARAWFLVGGGIG